MACRQPSTPLYLCRRVGDIDLSQNGMAVISQHNACK